MEELGLRDLVLMQLVAQSFLARYKQKWIRALTAKGIKFYPAVYTVDSFQPIYSDEEAISINPPFEYSFEEVKEWMDKLDDRYMETYFWEKYNELYKQEYNRIFSDAILFENDRVSELLEKKLEK